MGQFILTDANGNRWPFEAELLPDTNSAFAHILIDPNGKLVLSDGNGNLAVANGGIKSALNLTAAGVIKALPGRLRKIVIIAPGTTSGAFTFNDCTTTGAAAAANEIFSLPYNSSINVIGQVIRLDWPCLTGIVMSAVPGSGSPIVAVSYD